MVAPVVHPQVRSSGGLALHPPVAVQRRRLQVRDPSRPGKSNASGLAAVIVSTWWATAGMTCDGMDTTLVPAADFGVPTIGWPPTHDTARTTLTVPAPISTSLRRSSSTSPLRSAHHAHSSTSAR